MVIDRIFDDRSFFSASGDRRPITYFQIVRLLISTTTRFFLLSFVHQSSRLECLNIPTNRWSKSLGSKRVGAGVVSLRCFALFYRVVVPCYFWRARKNAHVLRYLVLFVQGTRNKHTFVPGARRHKKKIGWGRVESDVQLYVNLCMRYLVLFVQGTRKHTFVPGARRHKKKWGGAG